MRIGIPIALLIAVLVGTCVLKSTFPKYDTPRWHQVYAGGDGKYTDRAIVVDPQFAHKHLGSEQAYIRNVLKYEGKTFKPDSTSIYFKDNKTYRLITVKTSDGYLRAFHFNITAYYRPRG